ncbi:hypothetical protein [Treponema putidum]|uniref:Uncharacterized protein n=1 Tax=Treponema putidum TaxID=221027 RepID=A0AAE9MSK7_9SPIR|nr:hypothetical protein [Treponema putidum]UTY33369.1 hypothetical protein E4N74_04595 [Treponema putidum]
MFLKSKINLFKKSLFLCLFLIMGSFAAILNAAEDKVLKLPDGPIVFHGKELLFTNPYTVSEFEEKFGKSDRIENVDSEGWIVFYKKENIKFYFESNYLQCILAEFSFFDEIELKKLKISKGDSYSKIRNELKNKNIPFIVTEVPKQTFTITCFLVNVNTIFTKMNIVFSANGKQKVIKIIYEPDMI